MPLNKNKMQTSKHPLKGWIPYKLVIENKTPLVHWLYVGDKIFNEPFFNETISACKSHTYNSVKYKCVSSLESILEWADTLPEINKISFIFHISRCGSTLLSQLIGLDKKYIVLAEVPFFDELLRLNYKLKNVDEKFQLKILDAAIKFMGQKKSGDEEQIFIKTDSWHICFYKPYKQLYPKSEMILLYRRPDEVISSHQKKRGMQAVPMLIEPQVFGFSKKEISQFTLNMYTAKVLEKYLLLFEEIETTDKFTLLLDYKQGAMQLIQQMAEYLKITWDEKHILKMQERAKFHSKHPQQNFEKENNPDEVLNYLQTVMRLYNRLNEKRNNLVKLH
jgi:hypothetical protein